MAVSSGFFNAELNDVQELDRKYSSEDFGGLFDGVITDGIFKNYKNAFKVTHAPISSNGLGVYVDTGRAWYNKTWTLNTAQYRIDVPTPPATGYRRDAIVLRVDRKNERKNKFYLKKGDERYDWGQAIVPSLENSTDGKITEYLIAVLEISGTTGTFSNDNVKIIDTIYDPDKTPGQSDINKGITADKVAHYAKAIVPTDATINGIIKSLEEQFDSYQETYQHEFDIWFQEIKDSLGILSNDQVVRLSMMIGEIYASDYVSGKYPAVIDDALWLSTKDDGSLPEIEINFGYASLPYAPNGHAIATIVEEKRIIYNSQLTYSVGDYVWYGDPLVLYECTTDILTPESWDPSHWEAVET